MRKKVQSVSQEEIRNLWRNSPMIDWLYLEEYCCMLCERDASFELSGKRYEGVDRAHIWGRNPSLTFGGSWRWENIHLLCRNCHNSTEGLSGPEYWDLFLHVRKGELHLWKLIMTKGALHHYFNAHSLLEVDRIDRTLKEPVIYKTMKPIEDMWLGYLNEQYPILKKQFTEEQIPFLLGLGEPLGKGEGRELVLHDGKIILKKDIEIMVKV